MRVAVFDIEANGLLFAADTIWVLAYKDLSTGVMHTFTHKRNNIRKGLTELAKYDIIVAHNGKGYDEPLINKLYPDVSLPRLYDTFILSSLMAPDRAGGHSIAAYGSEVGITKLPDLDWTRYDEGMIPRCTTDVEIGTRVWERYRDHIDGWAMSVALEHTIARRHADQCLGGVAFDVEGAERLFSQIQAERDSIDQQLIELIPPHWEQYGTEVKRPFLKNGNHSRMVVDWDWKCDISQFQARMVWGPFSRVHPIPLNPNSHDQIKNYLLTQGWIPTEWNYQKDANGWLVKDANHQPIRTSPKLTEDSFDSIKGEIPKLVARRSILTHRMSMLKNENKETGWLYAVRSDGRVEAGGVPQGTPTGRYRHTGVVNVPKADGKVVYGVELRSLFIAGEGNVLIGTDASQLEARTQGHYTYPYDDGAICRLLLEGDVHTHNMPIFGVSTRHDAKTPYYGVMYGAQPPKLASILGCSLAKAKRIFNEFWTQNPGLGLLREDVIKAYRKNGWIRGLDGRRLYPRSEHSALNMLFQSAGSIIVKTATCFMWQMFEEAGIAQYVRQVLHMHDEIQFEVRREYADQVKAIIEKAWIKAGEFYNLNVPIVGDVKMGRNWAETH